MARQWNGIDLPRGVYIREYKTKTVIRVVLNYQGKLLRKQLDIYPSKANIKYAERQVGEYLNQIERKTFEPNRYLGQPDKNLIKSLFNDYLKLAEKTLKASTFNSYRKAIHNHLLPFFGELNIVDLKAIHIRRFIDIKNGASLKRISNLLTPLKNIVKQALVDELITHDPFTAIILDKLVPREYRTKKQDIDPFSIQELKQILSTSQGQLRNLFQFAFWTGLRTGELIALKWKDIDMDNWEVSISKSSTEQVIDSTKTAFGARKIKLMPLAKNAIKDQLSYSYTQSETVFQNPKTKQNWLDDRQIRERFWRPLLKTAQVRYRKPYNSRHTFASLMLSSGENIAWLSKYLGHSDVKITLQHYASFIPDYNDDIGSKATERFSSLL